MMKKKDGVSEVIGFIKGLCLRAFDPFYARSSTTLRLSAVNLGKNFTDHGPQKVLGDGPVRDI